MSSTAEWIRSSEVVANAASESTPALDAEERANQITHGLGFVLSLCAAGHLLPAAWQSSNPNVVNGCILYVGCMIALYAASTLSHSFVTGRTRDLFRLADQVCIYLFIAASVTPFALAYWSPTLLVLLLGTTWFATCVGCLRKVLVEGPSQVSLVTYLVIAGLPNLGVIPVLASLPGTAIALLLAGHIGFCVGIYFWLREGRIPYSHAIWHVCVLLGTFGHYAVIRWYVVESPLV